MYNFNFHQTFPPTAEYISRLLEICNTNTALTKEEISELTGIPTGRSSGKVEPHIDYAEYMGLIVDKREAGKHQLAITSLGNEILNQDPGLQEKVSLAVCHSRLSSKYGGADLWAALIKSILPNYPNGISDLMLKDEIEKRFKTQLKTGPFFSSYTGMFGPINIIDRDGTKTIMHKNNIDNELTYVYAYALLYEWNNAYPNEDEITAAEVEDLMISHTFGLDSASFYRFLESLAEKQIIHFNRQLAPYTIVKLKQDKDMILLLYSELC